MPFGLLRAGRRALHKTRERADYDASLCQEGFMRIKGQADIDVFISDAGYICLKQKDDLDGERLIEFAPAYGAKVASAISSLQEFAQAKFEKAEALDD